MKPTSRPMVANSRLSLFTVPPRSPHGHRSRGTLGSGRKARRDDVVEDLAGSFRCPLPLLEAGRQGLLHQVLRVTLRDVLDVRDLADNKVLGALVHLLFTERQALALA